METMTKDIIKTEFFFCPCAIGQDYETRPELDETGRASQTRKAPGVTIRIEEWPLNSGYFYAACSLPAPSGLWSLGTASFDSPQKAIENLKEQIMNNLEMSA